MYARCAARSAHTALPATGRAARRPGAAATAPPARSVPATVAPASRPSSSSAAGVALALGVLGLVAALEPSAAHAVGHGPALGELAESSDFWSNVARYASFFFSVLLGTAATAAKPVVAALKRSPASAAGVIVTAGLVLWGVSTTVSLMLGVGDGGSGPDDLGAFLDGLG